MLAGLVVGCECVVRERDEIEPMSAIVADLDERLLGVGLHDGSDRSGRPSAGVDFELDDVEDLVLHGGHVGIVAVGHGMSTHVEVRRGAASVEGHAPWLSGGACPA